MKCFSMLGARPPKRREGTDLAGSWTDKGVLPSLFWIFWSQCHHKNWRCLRSCGFGQSDEYFQAILKRSAAQVPDDNTLLGSLYACQGRMPESVAPLSGTAGKRAGESALGILIENF